VPRLLLALLAVLACATAVVAGTRVAPSGAQTAGDPVLPDLDQDPPREVRARAVAGGYALGFDTVVTNRGPGELRVTGSREPGAEDMQADQLVEQAGGGWQTVPQVGRLRYVDTFGHAHWHLMQFARYELHAVADPGVVLRDRKQGFCLADNQHNGTWCNPGERDLASVTIGLRSGGIDEYAGFVEGQDILIDRASAPSGRYVLVNRTDVLRDGATAMLRETTTANNAASVQLELTWPATGTAAPAVRVLKTCPDTWDCFPARGEGPAPVVAPETPGTTPPAAPEAPGRTGVPALNAVIARRLALDALRRTLRAPRLRPSMACLRAGQGRFVCRVRARRGRWSYAGRVDVRRGAARDAYALALTRRGRCRTRRAVCASRVRRQGTLAGRAP
jgi:hypothetical protein